MIRETPRYKAPWHWRNVAIWCAMAAFTAVIVAVWALAADVPVGRWFR